MAAAVEGSAMRPRVSAWLLVWAGAATVLLATSALASNWGRDALRNVVAACVVAKSTLGLSFPCADVKLGTSGEEGYALIRSPGFDTEYLVAPLAPLDGIESPELQSDAATGLWASAWSARTDVSAALGKPLARTAVALAVNAAGSRTQDHFHIHVDCLRQSVGAALEAKGSGISTAAWSRFPGKLQRDTYWVRAIPGESLDGVNIARLVAESPQAASNPLEHATVAVVPSRLADGADGFYVLANWTNSSAERLLDHTCRGR
jgi:CDP-diacylglycerol pyrophosphatase